ncbi:MAG: response regulator [Eubacteriales bacterium]|nr:response regulator [Eubacteriales bacterium]
MNFETKRVLLVEDEAVIRRGIKKMIEEVIGGYVVCGEAVNGLEALRSLDYVRPDVIVTDIQMDVLNGIEMIRRVRLQNAQMPIIIISGHADFRYAQEAITCGASAYLLKPIDRIELMQALNKACPSRTSADEEPDSNRIVVRVKEIITMQLDQEISLRSIASEIDMNHQYLSALFKSATGENFSHYVTRKRINKAKHMLETTTLKVYEIARLSGYQSEKHFSNSFKTLIGMTPTEFRHSIIHE